MDSDTTTQSRPESDSAPEPGTTKPVNPVIEALSSVGSIAQFSWQVIRDLPTVRKYSGDVLHQAALLVLSSGLIIWLMQAVIGYECGLEGSYTLKQIGAPAYSGIFNAWCGIREMAPYMWGYIFAAKVGCGLVAELGSMRIADEIDALEVMGIHTRSYLVGTRVLAVWIAMPFLYIIGLGVMYSAEYVITVLTLGGVSSGGYMYIFWLYQNPYDFFGSLAKVMTMGTIICFVGCYYGFTARGGPVGVGQNTAKSMMLNMVLIHVVGMLGTAFFWGFSPNAPVAN